MFAWDIEAGCECVCVCECLCVAILVRCIALLCLEGALEWNCVIDICPIILDLLCSCCRTIMCACWFVLALLVCFFVFGADGCAAAGCAARAAKDIVALCTADSAPEPIISPSHQQQLTSQAFHIPH